MASVMHPLGAHPAGTPAYVGAGEAAALDVLETTVEEVDEVVDEVVDEAETTVVVLEAEALLLTTVEVALADAVLLIAVEVALTDAVLLTTAEVVLAEVGTALDVTFELVGTALEVAFELVGAAEEAALVVVVVELDQPKTVSFEESPQTDKLSPEHIMPHEPSASLALPVPNELAQ